MAFFPVNIFFAVLFIFGIIWGWDGEGERQFFALFSSIFMFPLWLLPFYSIVDDSVCCTISTVNGWLPTGILENILLWNAVLMLFTGSHLMESMERDDPLQKAVRRMRKKKA